MSRLTAALILIISFLIIPYSLKAQDVQIGGNLNRQQNGQGALFDFSDPQTVNIKVGVWGFVKYPGKYIIPATSTLNDLLSYAGGPTDDAHLNDLRIFRTEEDSSQKFITVDYNELLWNKEKELHPVAQPPALKAGDILLVPGEPRLYFRDYLTISLAVVSTLISLSILILNIVK